MEFNMDITTVVIIFAVLALLYYLCYRKENYDEPKFPPKQFVMVKKPFCLNEKQRVQREKDIVWNSPYERNLSEWTHRGGVHGPRNTGFSPRYHDQKTVQYLPSWPNVTDNNEVLKEIPSEILVHEDEYPVFETSDKVNVDDILY
jgi:hypothetical protein